MKVHEYQAKSILARYGVDYADRSVSLHEAARRAVERIGPQSAPVDGPQHDARERV